MRSFLLCCTMLLVCAAASAQVDYRTVDYRTWDQSPQALFMTRAERHEWQQVRDDAAAAAFVSRYIARRGGVAFTELVQSRVALAARLFGESESKVAGTIRGRAVILLGAPASLVTSPRQKDTQLTPSAPRGGLQGVSTGGGVFVPRVFVTQTMTFAADRLPGSHAHDLVVYVEIEDGSGRERWGRGTNKSEVNALLEAAAAASIKR
jgi:hypothetical protein